MGVVANIDDIPINDRPYISRADGSIPHNGAACSIKGKYFVKSRPVGGAGSHIGHTPGIGHTRLLIMGSRGSYFEQKIMAMACAVKVKFNG
jgi:hypothetical protein